MTPTPPTKPVQQTLLFGKTPPSTVDQLNNLRCQGSQIFLERDGPKGATIQSVNAWMKTKILDSKIHTKLDNAATILIQQMQQLPVGQLPASLVFFVNGAWNQLKQPSTRRRRPLNYYSFLMSFGNDYAPNAGASLRYALRLLQLKNDDRSVVFVHG